MSPPGEIPDDPPGPPGPVIPSTSSEFPKISNILKGGPAKFSGRIKLSTPLTSSDMAVTSDSMASSTSPTFHPSVPSEKSLFPTQPVSSSTPTGLDEFDATGHPSADRPVVHDGGDPEENNFNHWWDWVKGKLDGAKDWANSVVDKLGNHGDKGENTQLSLIHI